MASETLYARHALGFVFGALDAHAVPGPILVEMFAALGFAENATRQLLARMVRVGDLETRRVGRVSVYSLAGDYRQRWLRIRHGDDAPAWTGEFQLVIYDVPERYRAFRDAVVEAAVESGYGRVRPGLMIGLREPDWLAVLDSRPDCLLETGTLAVDLGAARRLAAAAWRLKSARQELDEIAARLSDALQRNDFPDDPTESFVAQFHWTREVGRVRLASPNLPEELWPDDWPAAQVQGLFGALHERYIPASGQFLYRTLRASPHSQLIEGGWWPPLRDGHVSARDAPA